jgi:hypothetical protein
MKIAGWLLCVLAIGAAACDRTPGDGQDENATATPVTGFEGSVGTAGDGTVRVADIVASPNEYVGETVTVVADVEEVFGPGAFALDEDAPFAGGIDRDLLVLSKKAGSLSDIDDQWLNNKVRVTGTVGRMSVVEIEREIGWDLDPEIEGEVERAGAVLIASSVDRISQESRLGADSRQSGQQARAELPATASPLPLAGLLGLLSIGGAMGLRLLRRR